MAVPLTISGASQLLYTGQGCVEGWSLRETAAAAASVRLRDGTVSGQILATIALAASASVSVGQLESRFGTGVYVQIVSGAVEGVVYLG